MIVSISFRQRVFVPSILTDALFVFLAVTACRLHYLSYSKVKELETSKPAATLQLYKLLSHILAKQQGLTIGQLATLHSIIASPAQKKPLSRKAAQVFEGA